MIRRWGLAAGAAVVLLLGVAGCQSSSPNVPTRVEQSQSETARFQSAADAGEAAESVYREYLRATDAVSRSGGVDVNRLAPFVTASQMKQEMSGAQYLAQHGLKVTGSTGLTRFQVQSSEPTTGAVNAYACVDFSKARVVDNTGKDVTPKARTNLQTSLARFVWEGDALRVTENEAWSGASVC